MSIQTASQSIDQRIMHIKRKTINAAASTSSG